MITSSNLKTNNLASLQEYYSDVADNYLAGKTNTARGQFKALSKKQRKEFFVHLHNEWKVTSGNGMYNFFFEIL